MMLHVHSWPDLAAIAGPGLVAAVVAFGLARLGRRRPWLAGIACAAAIVVGWGMMTPWRAAWWPHVAADLLAVPALAVLAAAALHVRIRSPWLDRAAIAFAAWWLAGSAAGRPEFWRVWFAAIAVAWALRRAGAAAPNRAVAAALTVLGVVLAAGGGPVWATAALVTVGAALGTLGGTVPPALLMVLIAAADLGLGQAVRGRLGLVDLGCAGAIVALLLVTPIQRWLGGRLFGAGRAAAPVAAAACVTAAAWLGTLALHRP